MPWYHPGMDYHEFKREAGKDAIKALFFFFVVLPLGIAGLVMLLL